MPKKCESVGWEYFFWQKNNGIGPEVPGSRQAAILTNFLRGRIVGSDHEPVIGSNTLDYLRLLGSILPTLSAGDRKIVVRLSCLPVAWGAMKEKSVPCTDGSGRILADESKGISRGDQRDGLATSSAWPKRLWWESWRLMPTDGRPGAKVFCSGPIRGDIPHLDVRSVPPWSRASFSPSSIEQTGLLNGFGPCDEAPAVHAHQ